MDDIVYLPTLAIGLLLVLIYCVKSWRASSPPQITSVINLLFSAGGLIGGAYLILGTVFPRLRDTLADAKLYILVGGIATLYVSIQGAYRTIWPRNPDNAPPDDSRAA